MTGRLDVPISPLLGASSPIPPADQDLVRALTTAEAELISGLPSDDPGDPKRRRRVGHTQTEIEQQPACVAQTIEQNRPVVGAIARELAARRPERIVLTGCGDSLACHIGMRLVWEAATGLPAIPVQALDLAYYPGAFIDDQTLVLGLSSSGTTPRTVEAMLTARQKGAATVALTNTPGSSITDIADHGLLISAERKGWPTQASTAAMALEVQLAGALGAAMGRPEPAPELLPEALAGQVEAALAAAAGPAAAIGRRLSGDGLVHLCGGGPAFASALFGAAKIKECTSGHGQAHPLEEVHHYTSVKPGETMIILAPDGPSRARAADTARQVRAWGGHTVGIVSAGDETLSALCDETVVLPSGPEALAALTFTIPLHYIALHMALGEFERADNG